MSRWQPLRWGSWRAGLLVGALQAMLLLALGGQLLLDRATQPRGWGLTEPVDPDLPIRHLAPQRLGRVRLEVRQGRVVATPARGTATTDPASRVAMIERRRNRTVAALLQPVAFFLPEHGADPSLRPAGEELWAEVTLPPQGPPRPIRLGVSRGDRIEPLNRR